MGYIQSPLVTFAFESITVADSATRLTIANVRGSGAPAEKVFITVEVASIRYRDDGSDPTSSIGHLVFIGDTISLESRETVSPMNTKWPIELVGSDPSSL